MAEPDFVNHPPHYKNHPSGIDCLQVARLCSFCMGNVIKYVWRYADKNGVEDLKKAVFYVNDILTTGQPHHPPYKAKQLLERVIAVDTKSVRRRLFTRIHDGDLEGVAVHITKILGTP